MSQSSESLLGVGGVSASSVNTGKIGMQINQRGLRKGCLLLLVTVLFLTLVTVTNWSPDSQSIRFHVIHNQDLKENEIPRGTGGGADGNTGDEDKKSPEPEEVQQAQDDGSGVGHPEMIKYPPQIAEPSPEIVNIRLPSPSPPKEDPDATYKNIKSIWTYRCDPSRGCLRERLVKQNETAVQPEVCWLTCGKSGALWPMPSKTVELGKCLSKFSKSDLQLTGTSVSGEEGNSVLSEMWNVFRGRLDKKYFGCLPIQLATPKTSAMLVESIVERNPVQVNILVKEKNPAKISLDTDESYTIQITSSPSNLPNTEDDCLVKQPFDVMVQIHAVTIFGARHALETLSQLIAFDNALGCFQIVNKVKIEDEPVFPYRGILIDSARNFIPIDDLKRLIDGLSINKLNILHWHISDSNSFPFYSKRVPQMTLFGAYSSQKIYYPTEVKDLVRYALIRGVKVIPEIDAPSHAGNGWQWGKTEGLGDLAVYVNAEPWRNYCGQPPCGQLNPVNPNTLVILEKLYQDFLEVFDDDIFHMGGDEVYAQSWEFDTNIHKWMQDKNFSYLDLWGWFQEEALARLRRSNHDKPIKAIVWTGGMTAHSNGRKFLNSSDYIIQVWDSNSELIMDLLGENYQLIMSNIEGSYLDQGGGTWLGQEHIYPYRLWQRFYDNPISSLIHNFSRDLVKPPSQRQILGAEATLWSEKVNSQNMDSKTWPRGAALAENLWSHPGRRKPIVYSRLNHHNRRLIALGIHSDQLQPESCYLLAGHCEDPNNPI